MLFLQFPASLATWSLTRVASRELGQTRAFRRGMPTVVTLAQLGAPRSYGRRTGLGRAA